MTEDLLPEFSYLLSSMTMYGLFSARLFGLVRKQDFQRSKAIRVLELVARTKPRTILASVDIRFLRLVVRYPTFFCEVFRQVRGDLIRSLLRQVVDLRGVG